MYLVAIENITTKINIVHSYLKFENRDDIIFLYDT